jgi:hypothetical protein
VESEEKLIAELHLPLNRDQNRRLISHQMLSRADAHATVRSLPVVDV